jgi:hypothetical protein
MTFGLKTPPDGLDPRLRGDDDGGPAHPSVLLSDDHDAYRSAAGYPAASHLRDLLCTLSQNVPEVTLVVVGKIEFRPWSWRIERLHRSARNVVEAPPMR